MPATHHMHAEPWPDRTTSARHLAQFLSSLLDIVLIPTSQMWKLRLKERICREVTQLDGSGANRLFSFPAGEITISLSSSSVTT